MESDGESPFLIRSNGVGCTYRELSAICERWRERLSAAVEAGGGPDPVVWWTTGDYSSDVAGLLWAVAGHGGVVLVVSEPGTWPDRASPVTGQPKAWSEVDLRFDAGLPLYQLQSGDQVSPVARACVPGEGGLVLATTGTSGQPKWVVHRLGTLARRYRAKPHKQSRVLPLMNLAHIGGQDIFWRALSSQSAIVVPEVWSPEGVGRAVEEHRVTHLAATPTYLRGLLWREVFRNCDWSSVERITYGGEVMPAALLAQLREALPAAHLEQRYGLSETSAWSVRDVGDGFLAISGEDWKVEEGRLWCRTPASWQGYWDDAAPREPGSWYDTGDRVEQRADGAVRILGREGLMINVGGHKVSPERVEEAILELPGVQDCRAYARPDPILGQSVAVDLKVDPALAQEPWRQRVRKKVSEAVGREAAPMLVRLVENQGEWRMKQPRA